MKSGLFALIAAIAILDVSQASADSVIYSSVSDLSSFSWNNAYCSDCGPLAQDEPLSMFNLSSSASVTGLNLVTGPIYGDSVYAGLGGFTFEVYNSDHSSIIFSQFITTTLVSTTTNNTDIITGSVSGLSLSGGTYWAGFYADVLGVPGFNQGQFGSLIETTPHTGIAQFPLEGNIGYQLLGTVSDVPEPSTWAMMILGFAGIGFMAYRRRAHSAFAI
jgi:PEP-CTERM motif